jgi:hypothetical protein
MRPSQVGNGYWPQSRQRLPVTAQWDRAWARTCEQAHQVQELTASAALQTAGGQPDAAVAAYELPFPVVDVASGQRLAITLEESTAAAWRYVLAVLVAGEQDAASAGQRQTALRALTDSAVRAVQWRQLQGSGAVSVAFPGI